MKVVITMKRPNASYPDLTRTVENTSTVRSVKEKPAYQHNSKVIIEPELSNVYAVIFFLGSVILLVGGSIENNHIATGLGTFGFLITASYGIKVFRHGSTVGSTHVPESGIVTNKFAHNRKHEITLGEYHLNNKDIRWYRVTKRFYDSVQIGQTYNKQEIVKSFKK
jgi:hypothetical protein